MLRRENERERVLPDESSLWVHNLQLQSRAESRRGASFRDPSPLGPICLERAKRSAHVRQKVGSRRGVRESRSVECNIFLMLIFKWWRGPLIDTCTLLPLGYSIDALLFDEIEAPRRNATRKTSSFQSFSLVKLSTKQTKSINRLQDATENCCIKKSSLIK